MKVEVVERRIDVVEVGNVGAVEVSEVVVTRTVEVAAGHVEAHESAADPHPVYETGLEAQARVDAHKALPSEHHAEVHASRHALGGVDSLAGLYEPIHDYVSTFGPWPFPTAFSTAGIVSSANEATIAPVVVHRQTTIRRFRYVIGTQSGNIDLGIYDDAGMALWRSGSHPAPPTSPNPNISYLVSPDLILEPGLYWVAMAADNTTVAVRGVSLWGAFQVRADGTPFLGRMSGVHLPLPANINIVGRWATNLHLAVVLSG